jgi:hypothetical protein
MVKKLKEIDEKEAKRIDAFVGELKGTERPRLDELIAYLKTTDFFRAPASTNGHNAYQGGLVDHSLSVCDMAIAINDATQVVENLDSIRICALFHDVCKANFYVRGTKNVKIEGQWQTVEIWKVEDQFPLGHGEKSLYLINQFINLTNEEALAIRWHLGGFDTATHFAFPSGFASKQAFKESKLASLICTADFAATYLIDEWGEG